VAAPSLQCPFFNHTVVLLVDHGDDGSFGFVLNRSADVGFDAVLRELAIEGDEAGTTPVLVGGPVSVEAGWIVFDPTDGEYPSEETIVVAEGIAVSASLDMLRLLAGGQGPSRRVMTLGYAGWGPDQLENEMAEGSWIPVDLDPELVFEVPVEDRWLRALELLGVDPARVASHGVASA
jgi:putative transcriptional regulator